MAQCHPRPDINPHHVHAPSPVKVGPCRGVDAQKKEMAQLSTSIHAWQAGSKCKGSEETGLCGIRNTQGKVAPKRRARESRQEARKSATGVAEERATHKALLEWGGRA